MTKSEELAALDAFRESLPTDTYLAAWLDYARPHMAADIQNDIFPTFRPDECRAEMLADRNQARKIRDEAQAAADAARKAAVDEGRADAARQSARLARDIYRAQEAANQFITACNEIHRNKP